MSIGYIFLKKKDYFFSWEIPWQQCLGLFPLWEQLHFLQSGCKCWINCLSSTAPTSRSSVRPLLWPFPLCLLPCYVNSSKICSHKRHNPLNHTAGTSNDFIIFFSSLCCSGTAEELFKATHTAVKRCLWHGGQEEYRWRIYGGWLRGGGGGGMVEWSKVKDTDFIFGTERRRLYNISGFLLSLTSRSGDHLKAK